MKNLLINFGREGKQSTLENSTTLKQFHKSNNKDNVISDLIDQFENLQDVEEKVRAQKLEEIFQKIESKRQEYIIDANKAKEIIYGMKFLIENKHVQDVEAQRLKFITAKLAIQHKVDPDNIYPKSNSLNQKAENVQIDEAKIYMNAVYTLKDCVSDLENVVASGKQIRYQI